MQFIRQDTPAALGIPSVRRDFSLLNTMGSPSVDKPEYINMSCIRTRVYTPVFIPVSSMGRWRSGGMAWKVCRYPLGIYVQRR